MKSIFAALLLDSIADTASARIPVLTATCPNGFKIHDDEHGPNRADGICQAKTESNRTPSNYHVIPLHLGEFNG